MYDRAGIYFIYVLQEYVHFYVGFLEKKEITSLPHCVVIVNWLLYGL